MTAPTRRDVAVHESGHAVIEIVLGVPVEYASIRAGRTFRGVSLRAPGDVAGIAGFDPFRAIATEPPELRAHVERQIIGFLAGGLAEVYLAGSPPAASYGDDQAEEIARDALARLGPRLAELVVEYETREEPSDGDEANAAVIANAFAGPEAGAYYLEWLRCEARALVVRYREAILRVADALERVATLSGEQVAALVLS
jgi:hypothetical protein